MQRHEPEIAIIHDSSVNIDDVAGPLAKSFALEKQDLDSYVNRNPVSADLLVFFTNPRTGSTYDLLKTALEGNESGKIFVLPTHNSDSISKLENLGIDDYLILPIEAHKLRAMLKTMLNRQVERSWAKLEPVKQQALSSSLKCFDNCFSLLNSGQPLPIDDIATSCGHIRDAAALGGIDEWIDALDRHHSYSFRHSMFVCGSLTYFAHAIGIRGADLELLTVGGLLHDIGKSKVSNDILDKPGKLDDREWAEMKKHPEYSCTILLNEQNLDKIIVTMAASHHEKLDGTGYPDGLSSPKFDDFVRMTTIADVYSALIDRRAYKGSMTPTGALDMMESFEGHLDPDLMRAFREFVLDQEANSPGLLQSDVA